MAVLTPAEKKSRLHEIAADLPRAAVERHCARLDNDYWNEFPAEEIHAHLAALAGMAAALPYRVRVEPLGEELFGLTLIGGDFPGFLAAASGFLASGGYDIRAAKAFSFAPDPSLPALPRGGIIDFLLIGRAVGARPENGAGLPVATEMENLFRRFEAGESASIRVELYRRIGERLEASKRARSPVPLDIRYHALAQGTQWIIRGPDREAMLFCIAAALSLQGLSIQKLLTAGREDGRFEDRITVTGPGGAPIRAAQDLEKIRVGIALMERLLETLPAAVDLQAAASGLQALIDSWLDESGALEGRGALDPLPALSRVLTAGPRMWESVQRLGPAAFRGLLSELGSETEIPARPKHRAALQALVPETPGRDELFQRARAYRDREILKAELDLLLATARDLNAFSSRLQFLAEALLAFACDAVRADLAARHGDACPMALFALGKFGGEELGAGSDLEILMVYAWPGETSGPEPLRHGEFHERLCRGLLAALRTESGETFALDMRLRPHGESGPLAAGVEAWKEYFAPGGGALDYEKQSLIRLRPVHGDASLAESVLAARDAIAYSDPPVPIVHTLELHARQIELKTQPGTWNAKFSPGGMAELEYALQFLQLAHGASKPVRRHNLTQALEALLETGVLTLAEFEHLFTAHLFLRRLINALRLVRGQARDVHCPPPGGPEFSFLAKRLGYAKIPGATAEARLEKDLRQAQRVVGGFFRHRFQGGEKPEWLYASVAEALMDPAATLDEAAPALERLGMRDPARAKQLFLDFFDVFVEKRLAAAALLLFESRFRQCPDPEGVLQKLTEYLRALAHPDLFLRQALHHPPLLEMPLLIFAHSDVLAEWIRREGDGFKNLATPESLERPRLLEEFRALARLALDEPAFGPDPETRLCRLRNREYLRIALRDVHAHAHVQKITYEISQLSDALVEAAWARVSEGAGLSSACVLALGKLGGEELNYSSDIDLVFIADDALLEKNGREAWEKIGRDLIGFLSRQTSEGRLFRVDMNLRPWGAQGPLVATSTQVLEYFRRDAGGWELQAWLKARPVCGAVALGEALARSVRGLACAPENRAKVEGSMRDVRALGLEKLRRENLISGEVKLGPGGLRTVEFFAQSLQIRQGAEIPELLTGNTLEALGRLRRFGLLPEHRHHLLSDAYVFLRRVEHRLQLHGLQQRHALPAESAELERLALQMGFEDRIGQSARAGFLEQYRKHMLNLQPISAELFGH